MGSYVVVAEIKTGKEEKRLGPYSERKAERVANIMIEQSVDTEKYTVTVEDAK